MAQQPDDGGRSLPVAEYTDEEQQALLLADDLRERLQRERDAAARLRDYLFGIRGDQSQP